MLIKLGQGNRVWKASERCGLKNILILENTEKLVGSLVLCLGGMTTEKTSISYMAWNQAHSPYQMCVCVCFVLYFYTESISYSKLMGFAVPTYELHFLQCQMARSFSIFPLLLNTAISRKLPLKALQLLQCTFSLNLYLSQTH